jgi:hypothetical protein
MLKLRIDCAGSEGRLSIHLILERSKATGSQNELLDQRDSMATQFRSAYGAVDAYPHFIGVFDTVASLSNPSAAVSLIAIGTMLVMIAVSIVYFLIPQFALPLALLALTGAMEGSRCRKQDLEDRARVRANPEIRSRYQGTQNEARQTTIATTTI